MTRRLKADCVPEDVHRLVAVLVDDALDDAERRAAAHQALVLLDIERVLEADDIIVGTLLDQGLEELRTLVSTHGFACTLCHRPTPDDRMVCERCAGSLQRPSV